MTNKLNQILSALFLAVLVLNSLCGMEAEAQSPASAATITELLDKGFDLEREHRWQEAIQHYEKGIRKNPGTESLDRRLKIVRIHFDVVRRYTDASFLETVDRTNETAALELFREVLKKLETNYVDKIKLEELVRNGTAFLEVALTEKDFISHALANTSAEAIRQFRENIHKSVLGKPVDSREEATGIVAQVAKLAQGQLGLSPSATIHEFAAGAVGLLDPYSGFLTAGELRELWAQIEGNLIGMGVELWAEGEELRIVEVFPGGPAYDAGLKSGDLILRIGETLTTDVGAKRAADLLRGPEFSQFNLVYQRDKQAPIEIAVTRKRVDVPSVSARSMVDTSAGVGYIRITNFQKTTPREVDDALAGLQRMGMQSLIIDLRHNPGGLLDAAVEIADRFLPSGAIVSTRGRNALENHNYFARSTRDCETPLVVLIDGDSASASEILAGAIRDNKRGILVGQTTYGKGSVQGLYHTDTTNAGLRLTVSKFFSPQGYAISGRGIEPNVPVQDLEYSRPINIAEFISKNAVPGSNSLNALKPVLNGETGRAPEARSKGDDLALRTAIDEARKSSKSGRR